MSVPFNLICHCYNYDDFFWIEDMLLERNIYETPMVRGLAADNINKLYTETMIFL